MRQIVCDTETTGLEPADGHRIIEIGAVEVVNRRPTGRTYHQYLQPDRQIDQGAIEVHGITNEMLADKPRFEDVVEEFMAFFEGAELIIHNAPFDVGFFNAELERLGPRWGRIENRCEVLDTLVMARQMHPGQRNTLDALCKRYGIDNSHRDLHGALLDSEILAEVYLAMTGGQVKLSLDGDDDDTQGAGTTGIRRLSPERGRLPVLSATDSERQSHEAYMTSLGVDDCW